MKRESSIFGHFWLFQGIIYLTIYIFLGRIFCFWTPFVTVEKKWAIFPWLPSKAGFFAAPESRLEEKSFTKAVELNLFLKNHGGHVQLCRFTMRSFFLTRFFPRPIEEFSNTVSVSVLQWIQLTLGHVEIRELFGRLGLADSAGWLRSESHGLAPRRHGLKAEPPAPQG